jgi:hypothetical protein
VPCSPSRVVPRVHRVVGPGTHLSSGPRDVHTTGSHTNLSRSRSHNGPTNPRNKSKQKSTWKHNSRGNELSQSAALQADSSQGRGRQSAGTWWTVRNSWTDVPQKQTKALEGPRKIQTVRTRSADSLTSADGPCPTRRQSANHLQQKP